jgi:two-component system response regulator AtoC
MPVRVCIVVDELEIRTYLEMALRSLGYKVDLALDRAEALDCLQSGAGEIAAVFLESDMPDQGAIETLRDIRQLYPKLPVVIVARAAQPLHIVVAMRNGATDFLCMPITHEDLRKSITSALDVKPVEWLRPPKSTAPARTFLGKSPRMAAIQMTLQQVGWSEAPVLIQGETGSGKEVIARELHANSPRAKKPFLKLNCAALPSELVESELFGYERGAFTGAFQRKPGMFELADGGTILLDEIGDMDIRLQAKLLQVLQDHEFQRIGGKDTIKVDVRVLAATHRDLEKAIQDRTFREDLYYRLNVVNVCVPPLRERREDIIALTEFLLKKHANPAFPVPLITAELKAAILTWCWPGNVRELENFARKLLIFQDPAAAARELHDRAARKAGSVTPVTLHPAERAETGLPILERVTHAKRQAESDAILSALNATRWNRKEASALLKIDYKALLYKMKKLGMDDKLAGAAEDLRPAVMRAGVS